MNSPLYFDGKPVSIGIFNALTYLAPRFKARWGYDLRVRDGLRLLSDQWDAWNKRQAYLNGTGPFAPVAAYPDDSAPHIAGFGVDLFDTGPDDGVTVIGSARNNWLHAEGAAVGLTNVGRTFAEGWHFEIPRGTQWLGSPASSSSAELPETTVTQEEDDMLALKIKDGAKTYLCTLGTGVFRHLLVQDNPERVKNIVRSADDWQTIDIKELPTYLRTYGCDLNIWDVRAGDFAVLDPLSGSVKAGNAWTVENARYADLLKKLAVPAPEVVAPPKA